MGALLLVLRLAVRSVLAHRVKSLVVGGLLLVGTFVVVLGDALLDSVEDGMEGALTESLAGDLQVYSAKARDPLSLYGGFGIGSTEVGEIDRFEDARAALLAVEGVADVVPMGITNVTVFGRNEIDQVLTALRDAVADTDGGHAVARPLVARAKRIVGELAVETETTRAIADPALFEEIRRDLARAASPDFWTAFEADPLPALDFLDAKIAPLASDARLMYLRVIGTDPAKFDEAFGRFHVVEGTAIPPGRPGFMFSHRTYEQLVKNAVAAELDRLLELVVEDGTVIADDPTVQQRIVRMARQYRRITFQLDPDEVAALEPWLRSELPGVEGDVEALVQAFLTVDDGTIAHRHAAFYDRIAPLIPLHAVPVGGTITLRGFTKSGYIRAVEVPVYGTYEFTGLEKSGLMTAANLADLVTFRELYGKMSDRAREELAGIKQSVGVADVSRADAEAALFGGGAPIEAAVASAGVAVDIDAVRAEDPRARTFPPEELERGLVLNAAVIAEEGADREALQARVAAAVAPLGLQVIDWQTASGTIGQFVTVMRMVLIVALAIIFLVALIIVNNAMVMATLDRVPEIGTLRAIGAQRTTILGLFLAETVILGLVGGGLGALLALAVVAWLHRVGVPAPYEILVLLFGGERLHPTAGADDVLFGMVTITGVAVASALYPAILASRVQPIVAMQGRES